MSAAEIIAELPKLTEGDLRAVRQKLLEIAEESEEIRSCNQSALEGALLLDRMENRNAQRESR